MLINNSIIMNQSFSLSCHRVSSTENGKGWKVGWGTFKCGIIPHIHNQLRGFQNGTCTTKRDNKQKEWALCRNAKIKTWPMRGTRYYNACALNLTDTKINEDHRLLRIVAVPHYVRLSIIWLARHWFHIISTHVLSCIIAIDSIKIICWKHWDTCT